MILLLDIIFYSLYVVTNIWLYIISKFLLSVLNIKIVKKGKNHKAAVEMATPSFEQTITSSERPMSLVFFLIYFIIINFLLFFLSFEINYKEQIYSNFYIYFILLCIPISIFSYYIMKLYTKNDRHKRAIEKFNSYTLTQKISLCILSSILFCSLCGLTFYSIVLI